MSSYRTICLIAAGCLFILNACRASDAGKSRASSSEARPSPIAAKLPPLMAAKPAGPPNTLPLVVTDAKNASVAGEQYRGSNDGATDWAVIAATYKSFTAAQGRAQSLRSSFNACVCSVYPREGEGQNYYVVVASGMRRDAADLKREQAVNAGLPQDTYVTKLGGSATARSSSATAASDSP